MSLSTPVHKYGHVCAWGLPGEVAKRGGDDAVASPTTNDQDIARNPHPPAGLGRDGPISSLLLLADDHASTRRRALTRTPSRSQQTSPYLWTGVLSLHFSSALYYGVEGATLMRNTGWPGLDWIVTSEVPD
jgi:hypothetical protein